MFSCVRNRIIASIVLATAALQAVAATLLTDTLESSAIYPGTRHDFVVSIPDAYTGDTPAALYVGLDGPLYNAPAVIDSLIAEGVMPTTIGVYLHPGTVTDGANKVTRYNRSNEYDAIDSRLAGFIENELLPAVGKMATPDGREIKITGDPNLRAISGASSGGIGAFIAAWTRPDLFRLVYTTCGTFVAMRGGDQLAALVRKYEPKPIRVYLHDGSNDVWNPLFGHWYEQNQLMASALKFAGYDINGRWDDGTHSIRNGAALFPDAMRWLWRDHPAKIIPGNTGNETIRNLLIDGEGWTEASRPMPAAAPASRCLYPDSSYMVEPQGGGSLWLLASSLDKEGNPVGTQKAYLMHDTRFDGLKVIGMAFDTDGNLYVATPDGLQIADQNGRVRAIMAWPSPAAPDTFAFDNQTLWIKTGNSVFTRRINSSAAKAGQRVKVPSQGQA